MSKSILSACVAHIKASALTGKGRDDAADHYMAGARAALEAIRATLPAESDYQDGTMFLPKDVPTLTDARGYLSVLEAMACAE